MRHLTFLLCLLMAFPVTAQNRLTSETSLYLRQHAGQPIGWFPWGREALEKARIENKVIFVSVGYAACHWCHVMAEESFENPQIAALLNRDFVSIKIDRERRPDLDEQFSIVTTMLTGSTGWPTTVFLTPDGDPFVAGGYFPADDFSQLLRDVSGAWTQTQSHVEKTAKAIADDLIQRLDRPAHHGKTTDHDLLVAAHTILQDLDPFNGGFGDTLKFPQEQVLLFLLDQAARHGDQVLLDAVTLTLDAMLAGGIHDQIGGGFHRYTVDPAWHTPHFEKMLYNQSQMARVLLHAYDLTGNTAYARAARRAIDYVLRDMITPHGAFYSAEDADTILPNGHRAEGLFYTWTPNEMPADLAGLLGIDPPGVFEGRSIPHLPDGLPSDVDGFDAGLERLRQHRASRTRPKRDEKVILSWNADMAQTLVLASEILKDPRYGEAAVRAADRLIDLFRWDGGFDRIYFDGHTDTPGQLVDVAAYGTLAIALYDGGFGEHWLDSAKRTLPHLMYFSDDKARAFRMTETTDGIGTLRPVDDTELASGNAQALQFLSALDQRLAQRNGVADQLSALTAAQALTAPQEQAGLLRAIAQHKQGGTGALRVSNGGAVFVHGRVDHTKQEFVVDLRLGAGWHINAHQPLEDHLIGLQLQVNGAPLLSQSYPSPVTRNLGFSETPLSLYDRQIRLRAPIIFPQNGPAKTVLTFQACNDEICLPPDDMVFFAWGQNQR